MTMPLSEGTASPELLQKLINTLKAHKELFDCIDQYVVEIRRQRWWQSRSKRVRFSKPTQIAVISVDYYAVTIGGALLRRHPYIRGSEMRDILGEPSWVHVEPKDLNFFELNAIVSLLEAKLCLLAAQ